MAKAKILIVEDEAITAMDLQNRLKELDYDAPAIAASGEGAIKRVEEIEPDLVLMDILLKGDMDGIEAAEQIRDRFDIPVVYVTAYLDEERLEKTKASEPYGYITKPFGDKDLRPVIEMALQRHTLEKALRESETQYRSIFDSATDSFLIFDTDGNIVEANIQACKMYGYPYEELIKLSGKDIVHRDYYHLFEQFKRDVQRTGEFHAESVDVRKDGTTFDIEVRGTRFNYKYKPHLLAVIRDITERKKVEARLSESEIRFRELFDNMSSGVAIYEAKEGGKDFVFKDFNHAAEKIDHIKKEDLIGKIVLEVFPRVRDFGLVDLFQRVWTTGKSEHLPISFYKDERIVGWRENYVYKLPSGEIVAVYDDVTERKQAEEALLQSEIRYRTLVEHIPAITYIAALDESSTTRYVSPQIETILGISPADYKADPDFWVKHLHHDDRERVMDEIRRCHESDQPFISEYRMVSKDGRLVWLSDDAVIVKDDKAKPLHLQGVMYDITERKQMEEKQSLFSHALDSSIDGLAMGDLEGRITYVNDAFVRMFGYSREELIGNEIAFIYSED